MSFNQKYRWYNDRVKILWIKIQAWQLVIPIVWFLVSGAGGIISWFVFEYDFPLYVFFLGFPAVIMFSVVKSRMVQRILVFLGLPFKLRKKSVNPVTGALMGRKERFFFRLSNSIVLALWTIWPLFTSISWGVEYEELLLWYAVLLFVLWYVFLIRLIGAFRKQFAGRYIYSIVSAMFLSVFSIWLAEKISEYGEETMLMFLGVIFFILYFASWGLLNEFVALRRTRLSLVFSGFMWIGLITQYYSWEYAYTGRSFCPFFACLFW